MIIKGNNKGQVTIFIIIAVFIIGAVTIFFVSKGSLTFTEMPVSIEPVYNTFLSCLEENTLTGISILGFQGGYIELPDFEPGSHYMPFSSQLDFLGNPIPYWYYVSGNNIQKEQVPSENDMEEQLGDFIAENIGDCVFDDYYEQGFEISLDTLEDREIKVNIKDNEVDVSLDMNLNILKGEESSLIGKHEITAVSKLGTLYNSAKKVYEYEQESLFLEEYAVDTLRLYAPVDGVELSCSPLIWNTNDVFLKLQDAIEANTLAIKTQGDEFSLSEEENKYFVGGIDVEGEVRFLNSKDWAYAYDVNPSEGNVLLSKPVGNQEGLGILGFCYVPYHFVYSVKYPVLAQIFLGDELFQFPMAVVIQGNNPRESLDVTAVKDIGVPELCEQKNTEVQVNIYNTKLELVEDAEISYECFGTLCSIGETLGGELKDNFPQCINGDVIVKSKGYKDKRYQFSTVEQGSVDIILDKLYERNVNLKLNNVDYNGQATISFISDDGSISRTLVYPQKKTINLSEGQYEIQVSIYRNSTLTLGATSQEKCIEIPQSGLGGFFGFTKENCFTIEFPEQKVGNALAGGGKQNYYILESQLSDSNTIEINADKLPTPTSIEQLQNNYILFDEKNLKINFK